MEQKLAKNVLRPGELFQKIHGAVLGEQWFLGAFTLHSCFLSQKYESKHAYGHDTSTAPKLRSVGKPGFSDSS